MSSVVAQGAAASRGSSLRTAAWAGLFVVVAVAPLLTPNAFHLHLAVLVCLNVIIVSGLALISRTGQLSFGHGAFVAIGAYAAVLLGTKAGWPFWVAAIAAVLCAALIALALGWVILRLRGVYFVLVTFAFAELVRLVLLEWPGVTGGANGISGIAPASLLGYAFDTKERFYVLALVVAASCIGMLYRISHTPAGHTFDAICENAALAEASGLNVHRLQVKAYVIGSGVAGLGGVLLAHYVGFVSPESFNTALSVAVIVMLVIGGRESVWGPLVGAVLLTPLPELFRGAVQTQHIFYGIALILILRLLPGGLVQLTAALSRLRKRASP